MSKTLKIASFGEVLWDVFPDKKRLGGAPLNVALRLHSFGADVSMISAVGKDALGKETLELLEKEKLNISNIQTNDFPTGSVQVTLDKGGSPSYEIQSEVAWDNILATKEAKTAVQDCDALVIGSLAFREPASPAGRSVNQNTFQEIIELSDYTIFDLNLRPPYYDLDVVGELMEVADFIKMNDEELELLVVTLGIEEKTLEDELKAIAKLTNTTSACVTLGSEGAMLLHKGKVYIQEGFRIKVADSVGAGDSFLAGLVFGLLSGEDPQDSLTLACAIGALVASKSGANPAISQEEIDKLIGW
ncbi:carbohydrate kinase [Dokdonia sinensis]|uniref:Carbohydrate kinase n=1 Tax=Dokdonia sinensis TaxID=2479847 RepID=A0A3M0G1X2_9FLAO|nr:carbohydrate kinase [Dokdonia sinensis]RMB58578.1 carbohydrate kinase [Dokdonia sinensis]